MQAEPKLDETTRKKIALRFENGDTVAELSREFGVCASTIKRYCQVLGAKRPVAVRTKGQAIIEFAKRARSILWREDKQANKVSYDKWHARVAELENTNGGAMQHNAAIVRASKEFPCLRQLFREYDVGSFDPNPESHPDIQHFGKVRDLSAVVCQNIQQTYRENLVWAMGAAGEELRTKKQPATCPNDQAWYLYIQAVESPKDFLQRIGQVESKGDAEEDGIARSRKAGRRSIDEIKSMLRELGENDENIESEVEGVEG